MIETINQMIAEQGKAWLVSGADRTNPHQSVVITDDPERCWRLNYRGGEWVVSESKLTLNELASFFAAFGSHWRILMGARITASGGPCDVRAFIKNGRKRSQEWSVGIISAE